MLAQMKPTILLTGKTGQVGAELHQMLPELARVIAPDRTQLDLLRPEDIRHVLREVRPQLIVNAAAYTAVDAAETDEAQAMVVNAEGPALLAEEANRLGAALVHYSTDYVFDGLKTEPYDEADPTSPINVYGRTKLAGEKAIRKSGVPHLILRTSWLYERRGRNFLVTVLRLATEREELKIVCDQMGSPNAPHTLRLPHTKFWPASISSPPRNSAGLKFSEPITRRQLAKQHGMTLLMRLLKLP
jgi:dTDP-4-dehydrorhamnose reductase